VFVVAYSWRVLPDRRRSGCRSSRSPDCWAPPSPHGALCSSAGSSEELPAKQPASQLLIHWNTAYGDSSHPQNPASPPSTAPWFHRSPNRKAGTCSKLQLPLQGWGMHQLTETRQTVGGGFSLPFSTTTREPRGHVRMVFIDIMPSITQPYNNLKCPPQLSQIQTGGDKDSWMLQTHLHVSPTANKWRLRKSREGFSLR